jgi:hypothetical protein
MGSSPAAVAAGVFFVYCSALALAQEPARRNRVLLGSAIGVVCILAWFAVSPWRIPRDWIVPPILLLVAYWTSGLLFTAPSPVAESRLMAIDRKLRIREISARAPRALAEILEFAYAGVYPIIPVALVLHLWLTPAPDAGRFWDVILITDFVCFGMLPCVQTRPPRSLEPGEPWRSSFRRVNRELLGAASIGVNTFPSGHAAEALACALLVVGAPSAVVSAMFVVALGISAGAVFGRYHYAADAFAGFIVAVSVWMIF